jgi:hypothetical protein
MGVFVLLSHLIITLAVIAVYVTLQIMGKPVNTIEMILMAIVGYWFGAIGNNAIRPNSQTSIHNAQEVKVNADPPRETDVSS